MLGGDYRGLGIVRSLGRHGIDVCVVHGEDRIACTSRYARQRVRRTMGTEDQQVEQLMRLAEESELDRWVLFPTDEEAAWIVSRHHAVLSSRFRLTTSPWERYERAADKQLAYRSARALDVDVPETWFPASRSELEQLELDYPVILKPAVRLEINRLTHAKAWRVENRADLLERYDKAIAMMGPEDVMVQELIPGGGERQLSFAAACRDGEPVMSVTAQRRRQYPVDFGRSSTFVETVDRPDVPKPALLMLQELRLDGLVEIEFKEDPRDGRLKLLDVNARAWGWHSIGAAADVDFAHGAWLMAMGENVAPCRARPGVRWARLVLDVPVSAREILARRMSLRSYLHSLRPPLVGPMAALDDPVPTVVDLPLMVHRELKRIARRAKEERGRRSARQPGVERPARDSPEV